MGKGNRGEEYPSSVFVPRTSLLEGEPVHTFTDTDFPYFARASLSQKINQISSFVMSLQENTIVNTIQGLKARLAVDRNILWLLSGAVGVLIMAMAIAEAKWTYFAILFAPFLAVLVLKQPFLFPFGVYAMLLPFDTLLSVTGGKGATITKFLGAATIAIFCLKGAFERKFCSPDKAIIWWVLFVLFSTTSYLWAIEPSLSVVRFSTMVGLFMLYAIIASYKVQKNEYEIIKKFIVLGGFLAAVTIIYLFIQGDTYSDRATLQYEGRWTNPTKLGFDMLLPLSIAVALVLKQKKKALKIVFWGCFVIILFGIILTGSRGSLVGACAILIGYLMLLRGKRIGLAGMVVMAVVIIAPLVPEFFLERIAQSGESRVSGRADIWIVGLKALDKYCLFGAGLDNFPKAYTEFVNYSPVFDGLDRGPHNIFLGLFVELGIVGIFLLIMGLVSHYRGKSSSPIKKVDIDQYMLKFAFWGILINSLSLDTLWYKTFWLLLMLVLMYRRSDTGTLGWT